MSKEKAWTKAFQGVDKSFSGILVTFFIAKKVTKKSSPSKNSLLL